MGVLRRLRNWVYRVRQHLFFTSMVAYPFHFAMLSHAGRVRKGNEDTCAASIEARAFVVCDGMGGAAAGEIASALAAETFLRALEPQPVTSPRSREPAARLDAAIHHANQAVFQESRRSDARRGMGTTLVALLLEAAASQPGGEQQPARPRLMLANVGDSRCYRFRAGNLEQLTHDHSLVEEQVRAGELTPFEATQHPWRNIITRAVGSQALVEPDIEQLDAEPGDLYLLASDGLTRDLSDDEIADTIRHAYQREEARTHTAVRPSDVSADLDLARIRDNVRRFDLAALCQALIDRANQAGGGDNITVLLLAIK